MMNCSTTYSNSSTVSSAFKTNHEAFQKRLKLLYPCVDDVTKLPQAWSPEAKAPSLGLTYDNLGCYFKGNFRSETDGDKYEASAGRDGLMGIGLASETAVLEKFPGCARDSYGYKADDGSKFSYDGKSHPYGPTFTTGDVIGCGYNLIEGKCFFTKNGSPLGEAFDNIPSNILLYPSIGLKTSGEEIRANFGQEEFKYDIDQDLRTLKKKMTLDIANYPISDFSGWQSTLHKLVQSWLLENNYPSTANAFTKEARLDNRASPQQDAQQRSRFQQLILSGRISEAIRLMDRLFPNLLHDNPRLLFVLKCRQFVEMISGADDDDQPMFDSCSGDDIGANNGVQQQQQRSSGVLNGDQPSDSSNHTTTTSKNGCSNGMIGSSNGEKIEQSGSSSSLHDLMDIDQPPPTSSPQINSSSSSSNKNNSSSTNANENNNNSNNNHHRNSTSTNKAKQQHSTKRQTLSKIETNGSDHTSNNVEKDPDFMVNEEKFARLLESGRELLEFHAELENIHGKQDSSSKMLHDTLGLIAYENPKNSCLGKTLDPSGREYVSQLLNSMILKQERGEYYKQPLENVMNHLRKLIEINDFQCNWLLDGLF